VKWGYIPTQTFESERSKRFAVSISLHIKAIRSYLKIPGIGKYPQVPRNRAEFGENNDARKAVSATLSVLK